MLAVALVGVAVPSAHADERSPSATEQDKSRAKAVFRRGAEAFADGRYKDAVDLFLRADAIVQNEAFAFNASHAYSKMGDDARALRWAREYLRRAPTAPDRKDVERMIRQYERHLEATGVQQVTISSTPAGATLLIDEQAVGVTPWTGEVPPGAHVASLRLRGHEDVQRDFTLPKAHAIDVSVTLDVAPEIPASLPVAPVAPPSRLPSDEGPSLLLPLGIAALGVGVLSFGFAVGLEAGRASAEQDAIDEPFQLNAHRDLERAADLQTSARVLVGVGGGFAALGAVLLTIELVADGDAADTESTAFDASCTASDCVMTLRGTF